MEKIINYRTCPPFLWITIRGFYMKLDTLAEINEYLDELHIWILEVIAKHDIK